MDKVDSRMITEEDKKDRMDRYRKGYYLKAPKKDLLGRYCRYSKTIANTVPGSCGYFLIFALLAGIADNLTGTKDGYDDRIKEYNL